MWLLKDSSEKPIYLRCNGTFTVGRKKGSLVLAGDDSVSRNHAEITVTPKQHISQIQNNTEPLSTCKIKDPGSKYGSFVLLEEDSELQITKDGNELQHLDKIRFGVQQSIFTVMYVPVITAISGLEKNEKDELQSIMNIIDGKITPGWEDMCTHMTISKPNISEKLTCALASGAPVVPMNYWKCLLKAFEANEQLPDPVDFAKIIDDKLRLLGNISVRPDQRRKTIFKNLKFVHYDSNQYNLYSRMIVLAGGESLLWRDRTQKNMDVCADNVIVLQLVESNSTQATGTGDANYAAACEKLGKCRRRTIPTSEIALAIFHCSTDKCCNPMYDHAGMFKKKNDNRSEKSSVLALDTQDIDPPIIPRHGEIKPSTSKEKLATIIHESSSRNVCIRESTEQADKISTQDSEISVEKSCVDLPVSTPNISCLSQIANRSRNRENSSNRESQFDEASVKVASLNYEIYAKEESIVKMEVSQISTKRDRENDDDDDDDVGKTMKKVCGEAFSDERANEKERAAKKIVVSYDDMMPDDEDMVFFDEKSSIRQDLFGRKTERADSMSPLPVVRKIRSNEISRNNSLNESKEPKAGTSVSGERASSESIDETETSRKRKASSLESSPPADVTKSPLKRNKTARTSPKKISKVPEKPEAGQPTLTKFLSPKKSAMDKRDQTPARKIQRDSTEFITPNANTSGDTANRSTDATEHYKKPYDPDTSKQPLLRIESPTDIVGLAVPKFGKSFRKAYTINPRRIELNDMRSWSEESNDSKKNILSDEEAITPRKVSPPNRMKKMFRV